MRAKVLPGLIAACILACSHEDSVRIVSEIVRSRYLVEFDRIAEER